MQLPICRNNLLGPYLTDVMFHLMALDKLLYYLPWVVPMTKCIQMYENSTFCNRVHSRFCLRC